MSAANSVRDEQTASIGNDYDYTNQYLRSLFAWGLRRTLSSASGVIFFADIIIKKFRAGFQGHWSCRCFFFSMRDPMSRNAHESAEQRFEVVVPGIGD